MVISLLIVAFYDSQSLILQLLCFLQTNLVLKLILFNLREIVQVDIVDLSTVDVILISNAASIAALPFITEVSMSLLGVCCKLFSILLQCTFYSCSHSFH